MKKALVIAGLLCSLGVWIAPSAHADAAGSSTPLTHNLASPIHLPLKPGTYAEVSPIVWCRVDYPIAASFERHAEPLAVGYCGASPTNPASSATLLVLNGRKVTTVNLLGQLAGHVAIKSPQEALLYVRLATSPQTFQCLQLTPTVAGVEVLRKSDLTRALGFGQKLDPSVAHQPFAAGYGGVLEDDLFRALRFPVATCRRTKAGDYRITRRLMVYRRTYSPTVRSHGLPPWMFLDVVESVKPDGTYALLSQKAVPNPMTWDFPSGD